MARIFHFNSLRTILELFVAIALLSGAVHSLPSTLRISGEFLRRLAGIISSPLFVFLLGNFIVAALLIANATSDKDNKNLYNDLVITKTETETLKNIPKSLPEQVLPPPCHVTQEEVIFQDKEIILSQLVTCESNNKTDESTSYCSSDSDKKKKINEEEEDQLSDEEFQRAVEEFIAKHLRFRRQESLAIVLQSYSPNSLPEIATA